MLWDFISLFIDKDQGNGTTLPASRRAKPSAKNKTKTGVPLHMYTKYVLERRNRQHTLRNLRGVKQSRENAPLRTIDLID